MPHAPEDCVVVTPPKLVRRLDPVDLPSVLTPSESPSVAALFGEQLVESRLVMAGSDCASLGALRLNSRRMGLVEKRKPDGTDQLRCWFYDTADGNYNLPVVSRALHAVHQTEGLKTLNTLRTQHRSAHMRIGLAHPFDDGRAFLMVNHVLFF